jgi:hypothetical protein
MQGSNKIIEARVISISPRIVVSIKKEDKLHWSRQNQLVVINRPKDICSIDDLLEGYAVRIEQWNNRYGFYCTKNKTNGFDVVDFANVINMAVCDRINREVFIHGRPRIRLVDVNNMKEKKNYSEYVLARRISINILLEYAKSHVTQEDLAAMYNIDRCSVISAINAMSDYSIDKTITEIINDVREEIRIVYDNIRMPYKQEVFEFIPQ